MVLINWTFTLGWNEIIPIRSVLAAIVMITWMAVRLTPVRGDNTKASERVGKKDETYGADSGTGIGAGAGD